MQTNHWIWQHKEWPEFTFDANKLLPALETAFRLVGELEVVSQSIGEEERMSARERTLTDDAVETAAIEGEMLRRSSVRSSIRKRIGLPLEQEDWDEHTDGLIAVLFDARNPVPSPLTKERLFGWHAGLFPTGYSGLKRIRVGKYRGNEEMQIVSGAVGKEVVHYVAPPCERLADEMDTFLAWVNAESACSPLIKAGTAHLWFITRQAKERKECLIGLTDAPFLFPGAGNTCPKRGYGNSPLMREASPLPYVRLYPPRVPTTIHAERC